MPKSPNPEGVLCRHGWVHYSRKNAKRCSEHHGPPPDAEDHKLRGGIKPPPLPVGRCRVNWKRFIRIPGWGAFDTRWYGNQSQR